MYLLKGEYASRMLEAENVGAHGEIRVEGQQFVKNLVVEAAKFKKETHNF